MIPVLWALLGVAAGLAVQRTYPWLARLEQVEEPPLAWLDRALPLVVALGFGLLALKDGFGMALLVQSVALLVLAQVFAFDLQHGLVLDRVILPATALAILTAALYVPSRCGLAQCNLDSLVAALGGAGFYLLLLVAGQLIFRREALGLGDVKLAGFIGAILGLGNLAVVWGLILGMLLGGVIGLGLVLIRVKAMGDYIPYGPFMCLGAALALFLYVGPHPLLGGGG
ncbi:MAG: prepilin peptidase [Candidatus Dormibacteria bacterium]